MYSIDDFYEQFNEYCERNDKIYRLHYNDDAPEVWISKDDEETIIAKCFIQVTDVYKLKNKFIICYELELDSYYNKVTNAILKREIIFINNSSYYKEINALVKIIKEINSDLIYNEIVFKKALMEYFIFSLAAFINSNVFCRCKVGWNFDNENKQVFSGITHEPLGHTNLMAAFLFQIKNFDFKNLVKDDELYLLEGEQNSSQDEKHRLIQESMEKVIHELKKNPDMCVLFAYDILALTYYFLDHSGVERFPIAIHGNGNTAMAKIVANIFCNMQLFDPSHPNTIIKNTNIQYTSIFCNLDDYICYADLTMLIPISGGLYRSNDHKLTKIISETVKDEINYFPVFVTDKVSKIMQIISVDVSKFKNFPYEKNSEEMIDLKASINRLLLEYILFHYRASNFYAGEAPTLNLKNKIRLKSSKQVTKFKNLKNLDGNVEEQYLLYIEAMNYFYQFLKTNSCNDLAKDLSQLCFKVFQMRASDSENTPTEDNIVIENFKNYIWAIFKNKELIPDYFHAEGVEKRGKKEACYYLDFNQFYSHFLEINPEISIDERALLHILKSFRLIKTKNDVSYGVERKFEGMEKKIYALAVLKEKINII